MASTAAVHEDLTGGFQKSKYYIYVDFENSESRVLSLSPESL